MLLATVAFGALFAPAPARADGPGYGGDADSLTVRWQPASGAAGEGLAVYAVGFRGGSAVKLRVGAAGEQAVKADPSGALRILVVKAAGITARASELPVLEAAAGRLSAGTSVLAVGETPAGDRRTLVGAVPPPAAGAGPADVVPWAGSLAVVGGAVLWFRRRTPGVEMLLRRYRHPARHRG